MTVKLANADVLAIIAVLIWGSVQQTAMAQSSKAIDQVSADSILLSPAELSRHTTEPKVRILQDRFFNKAWRAQFGLSIGSVLNQSYTDTTSLGANLNFYWSEWFGVQYQYQSAHSASSSDLMQLQRMRYFAVASDGETATDRVVHPEPVVERLTSIQDYSLITTPLYGKISMMGLALIYLDILGGIGFSQVDSNYGRMHGVNLLTGLQAYFDDRVSAVVELRGRFFRYSFADQERTYQPLSISLSAGYFLWK